MRGRDVGVEMFIYVKPSISKMEGQFFSSGLSCANKKKEKPPNFLCVRVCSGMLWLRKEVSKSNKLGPLGTS
jgi:hypothetical protein